MWRVLCVDDDEEKAEQVGEYFTQWGKDNPYGAFEASVETNFERASRRLATERFDLLTLDLHGEKDPPPGDAVQQGQRVLSDLKQSRFLPVIFYSGFAEKITTLESLVVRVVKKGEKDLEKVREAAKLLYDTGLPRLMRHVEEEQRSYVWDTVDRESSKFTAEGGTEELCYLVARRIAARLNRESLKELFGHGLENARPIEFYIYPAFVEKVKTGHIYGPEGGRFWIVATPACDFAQGKAEEVLLVGATPLTEDARFSEWRKERWVPPAAGAAAGKQTGRGAYNELSRLLVNNAGARNRFLPGTFFIPDLVVDMQLLRQLKRESLEAMPLVCKLDSPYREDLLLHLSKYYGRVGTPDLDLGAVFERLRK